MKRRYQKFRDTYYTYVKCKMCGANHSIQYHHTKGGKEKNLAQLWSYSKQRVREEFRKCIPLCANCHSIVHKMLRENKK